MRLISSVFSGAPWYYLSFRAYCLLIGELDMCWRKQDGCSLPTCLRLCFSFRALTVTRHHRLIRDVLSKQNKSHLSLPGRVHPSARTCTYQGKFPAGLQLGILRPREVKPLMPEATQTKSRELGLSAPKAPVLNYVK